MTQSLARLETSITLAAVYVMAALLCLGWMGAAVWRKVADMGVNHAN